MHVVMGVWTYHVLALWRSARLWAVTVGPDRDTGRATVPAVTPERPSPALAMLANTAQSPVTSQRSAGYPCVL